MFNQLLSLHIKNNVLCRKFDPLDGNLPFLQKIFPRSMVPEFLTASHISKTAGHLGTHKVIEKVRQRFFWPGVKDDVEQFIQCCDICQKKSGPPKTHRHSLVDWKIRYPFHHIGLAFFWTTSHFYWQPLYSCDWQPFHQMVRGDTSAGPASFHCCQCAT